MSDDTEIEIVTKVAAADESTLRSIVEAIAVSAMDDGESGADTAAVVYSELARIGIVVP